MGKDRDAIKTVARQLLRDDIPSSGESPDIKPDVLDIHIDHVLVEISQRKPYEVKETVTACNRTGAATSTSANHLVDATNAHFVAGDVGKTVYNSTDKTTAKVTAYNSASDLTLDTDIMTSGETYYLYHYQGTSGRDFNKSNIENLIKIEKAEYLTRQEPPQFRNVTVFGDVVTIDSPAEPSDGDEVFLYCHKTHQLTKTASTLSPDLERVLIQGIVAYAALAWLNEMRAQIVPTSITWYERWANNHYVIYQRGLQAITAAKVWEF